MKAKREKRLWRVVGHTKTGGGFKRTFRADTYEEARARAHNEIRGLLGIDEIVLIEEGAKKNPMKNPKRKFSPAQIAAQKRFAAMAKAGKFRKRKKSVKRNPVKRKSAVYKRVIVSDDLQLSRAGQIGKVLKETHDLDGHSITLDFGGDVARYMAHHLEPAKKPKVTRRNPVKPGARRSPPKRIKKRNPVERYVIRGTKKTKTGYLHYYLGGNRFLSDFLNADRYSLADGEKKMRAIQYQLPSAIDNITLIKAK